MIGSFGQAIFLVCTLAVLCIVSPFFFLQASHIYITTLCRSSNGEDRFRWPRDSFYDWFGQGLVIFGVLFVWSMLALMPVAASMVVAPMEWGFAVWLAVLWLTLPISLCSVLMAPSRLMFLFPPLIGRMFVQGRGLFFVYFITTQLPLVVLAGLWLIVIRRNPLGIFVAGVALPFAILLHARAWGPFAWLAMNYDRKPPKKKRKPKLVAVEEPLAVDLETIDEEEPSDYAVKPSLTPVAERLVTLTEHYDEQHEYERKLRQRLGDPNPDVLSVPRVPTYQTALGEQIFSFLVDSESLGVCFTFGLVCLLEMTVLFMFVGIINLGV